MARAAEILCADYGVAHIDMNFGCPVPKVTRKGGGAALPWKRRLLASILEATVAAAAPYGVPVTMKTRQGIDEDHLTYLEAGAIAQEAGAPRSRCMPGPPRSTTRARRTGRRSPSWSRPSTSPSLATATSGRRPTPYAMMASTGCEGVVVGRGCLGRPWLFRDLAASLRTSSGHKSPLERPGIAPREGDDVPAAARTLPSLGEVAAMMRRHAELLVHYMGEERGCKETATLQRS